MINLSVAIIAVYLLFKLIFDFGKKNNPSRLAWQTMGIKIVVLAIAVVPLLYFIFNTILAWSKL